MISTMRLSKVIIKLFCGFTNNFKIPDNSILSHWVIQKLIFRHTVRI